MKRITIIRTRIKLARIAQEYTQDYVGRQLHISQIAYHKLENGKTQLKVKTLLDLAGILEVKGSYLLDGD